MFSRRSSLLAALSLCAGAAVASADTYSASTPWLSAVRTDFVGSSFDSVPTTNSFAVGPTNGYTLRISAADTGSPNVTQYQSFSPVILGITPTNNLGTLVINVEGTRPANAFFMSAGIISGLNLALTSGQIRVETDRGDGWNFSVGAGSTSLGATTVNAFRQLRVSWFGGSGFGNVFLDSLTVAQTNALPHADSCENALAVTPGEWPIDNRTSSTISFNTSCADTHAINDVWFRYTAAATGDVTFSTAGSAFDTVLSVYSGTCYRPVELGCHDDVSFPADPTSLLTLHANAGASYLVRVAGYDTTTPTGNGRLIITQNTDPVCPGDFNHSGSITVQDIFDFLSSYFAGCP